MKNYINTKKVLAIIAFFTTIVIALLFADFEEFTFENNWWQLLLVVISIGGTIAILTIDRFSESSLFLGSIVVWSLSLVFAIFVCVDCFVNHTSDVLLVLLASLILISSSISLLNRLKNSHHSDKLDS